MITTITCVGLALTSPSNLRRVVHGGGGAHLVAIALPLAAWFDDAVAARRVAFTVWGKLRLSRLMIEAAPEAVEPAVVEVTEPVAAELVEPVAEVAEPAAAEVFDAIHEVVDAEDNDGDITLVNNVTDDAAPTVVKALLLDVLVTPAPASAVLEDVPADIPPVKPTHVFNPAAAAFTPAAKTALRPTAAVFKHDALALARFAKDGVARCPTLLRISSPTEEEQADDAHAAATGFTGLRPDAPVFKHDAAALARLAKDGVPRCPTRLRISAPTEETVNDAVAAVDAPTAPGLRADAPVFALSALTLASLAKGGVARPRARFRITTPKDDEDDDAVNEDVVTVVGPLRFGCRLPPLG